MDTPGPINVEQVELLFCLALLEEGADVTRRVLGRFVEFRDNPPPYIALMLRAKRHAEIDARENRADRLEAALRKIDLWFQSGNDVPVDRATITEKDWLEIKKQAGL